LEREKLELKKEITGTNTRIERERDEGGKGRKKERKK
jgi:hypothetical protein